MTSTGKCQRSTLRWQNELTIWLTIIIGRVDRADAQSKQVEDMLNSSLSLKKLLRLINILGAHLYLEVVELISWKFLVGRVSKALNIKIFGLLKYGPLVSPLSSRLLLLLVLNAHTLVWLRDVSTEGLGFIKGSGFAVGTDKSCDFFDSSRIYANRSFSGL